MKRILSFTLIAILLCGCFIISAFSANEGGISFKENTIYLVENDLEKEPVTIEATVFFNKRFIYSSDCGSIFGNWRGLSNVAGISLSIDKNGSPSLTVKGDKETVKNWGEYSDTCTFDAACVFTSEWVHIAVVRDTANGEARCYIDGELVGTKAIKDLGAISLCDYVVGGDMTSLNKNYFKKGKLGSLAVYSDIRTEAEIKSDMKKVGTDNLLLHYDFMNSTEESPAVLTDLSKNKNNATLGRIFFTEKEPVSDYAYTFAVIGDTQIVALKDPDRMTEIYEYVYDNINEKNIEMVIGLGDITDTLSGDHTQLEWEAALNGMKIIDGYVPHIPIRGNHDNSYQYNSAMAKLNYADIIDGYMTENDYRSTYVDIEIGSIPYLFLQLDFFATKDQLNWANKVVEKFPNHNVIVSTHSYMNADDDILEPGDIYDASYTYYYGSGFLSAETVWNEFISQHENIVMVLCGHISSDHVSVSKRQGVNGNTVTEVLIDFQAIDETLQRDDSTAGIVNLFHFSEDGKKVTVETYSTLYKQYFYDYNQLTFELDTVTSTKYVKPEKAPVPERSEANRKTEIKMTANRKTAYVNGIPTTLDAAPVIKFDRTMLPVRFVAENLGATVGWNDATKTVTVKSSTVTIEIVIGASTAKVNGTKIALDSPAYIDSSTGRTYLPVRAIAENLGATVDWNSTTKTVTLVK